MTNVVVHSFGLILKSFSNFLHHVLFILLKLFLNNTCFCRIVEISSTSPIKNEVHLNEAQQNTRPQTSEAIVKERVPKKRKEKPSDKEGTSKNQKSSNLYFQNSVEWQSTMSLWDSDCITVCYV